MADHLGIDQSTVSRMERQAIPISRQTQKLLDILEAMNAPKRVAS